MAGVPLVPEDSSGQGGDGSNCTPNLCATMASTLQAILTLAKKLETQPPSHSHSHSCKENRTWIRPIQTVWGRWSQSTGRQPHRNRSVSPGQALHSPYTSNRRLRIGFWALVQCRQHSATDAESLAPPISAKLAKRLQTLWDVTVPYSAKRQLHEDYAKRPSYLPLFVVPQLPKELSLKLTKTLYGVRSGIKPSDNHLLI